MEEAKNSCTFITFQICDEVKELCIEEKINHLKKTGCNLTMPRALNRVIDKLMEDRKKLEEYKLTDTVFD